MARLTVRRVSRRDRPPDVPPSAVEERIAWLDDDGRPVDEADATGLVSTYYDSSGSPVFTTRGTLGPPR